MTLTPFSNQREFIRLDSVFPVEFQFLSSGGKLEGIAYHGFTSNISKGGLCLELFKAESEMLAVLNKEKEIKLGLKIHIPIGRPAIMASARVSWVKKVSGHHSQVLIGIRYEDIQAKDLRRIARVAYAKAFFPRIALVGILILLLGLAAVSWNNFRLSSANKKLIEEVVGVLKDSEASRQELRKIRQEKGSLEEKLTQAQDKIQDGQAQLRQKAEELKLIHKDNIEELKTKEVEIEKFKAMIRALEQDSAGIMNKIGDLSLKEEKTQIKLSKIKEKKVVLEKANFEKMYQWVHLHQNPRTGLIESFEGDGELGGAAFTYDQALAVITFSYFKDYPLAGKILDFYQSKARKEEGFYNGYFVSSGEASEFTVHSGPNLWLGIAALQYARLSGDKSYLPLARDIAGWMIKLQKEDSSGGLKGGPETSWYSTEHNLDGFAFFNMLSQMEPDPLYKKTAQDILSWLKNNAYDSQVVPVKRGRGDATIATDTYAWSIASLGPEKLEKLGMNPEEIMGFAQEHCAVETDFLRPNGEYVRVRGFDFAKQEHLARGGVISCEWTAQMALSYKILSRYFASKADAGKESLYREKADESLEELTKMIISSPSRTGQGQGCLPYASSDYVDTGHGWRTPKGKNTGSLSSTIYAIFAYYGFNPLELDGRYE